MSKCIKDFVVLNVDVGLLIVAISSRDLQYDKLTSILLS